MEATCRWSRGRACDRASRFARAGLALARSLRSLTIDSTTFAATLAHWCHEKKGESVAVYQVSERIGVADYFVLVTGLNRNHVRALENELHVRAKAAGIRHHPVEGHELRWWVVLDFDDVVVHLLQPEARAYYDLDRLYADCPRLDWQAVPAGDVRVAEA